MKKTSNVLWGIVLVAAGVLIALNAMEIISINIFFEGWWTLFIIVPCAIGLFTEREKLGNLIGIAIGVVLLLCCQDVLSFTLLRKLLLPAVIVVIGLKLVLGGLLGNKANEMLTDMKESGQTPEQGCAIFSGCDRSFEGQAFEGAELTAVFGGVKWDLRNAVIEKDCAIKVSAIFGGIDILVPETVNVKVNTNNIFGGTSNKTPAQKDVPTVYVNGLCLFGGVDVK